MELRSLICVLAVLAWESACTESSSIFYLRLDEFENYEGLLGSHMKCDSGRPCDPAFVVKTKGIWGEFENSSDCYADANHVTFGSTIGTVLSNPLTYPESSVHFPISLDIRVKDCMFGSPEDDIADFFQEITDLPSPYLYTEMVDPVRDTERVRKIQLQSLSPAPISIKLRVTVWHRCIMDYYGSDCSKFCKVRVPGYECNGDGVPICVSAACQQPSTVATIQSTTASIPSTSTAATSTAATSSAATSSAATGSTAKSRTAISITSSTTIKATTTGVGESTTGQSAAYTEASPTWEAIAVDSSALPPRAVRPSENGPSLGTPVNAGLVANLGAILIAVLLAAMAVLIAIKLRGNRRSSRAETSSVRFHPSEIGYVGDGQNFANPCTYVTIDTDGAAGTEPDAEVYEDPGDPGERELPPLPARDQPPGGRGRCGSFVQTSAK